MKSVRCTMMQQKLAMMDDHNVSFLVVANQASRVYRIPLPFEIINMKLVAFAVLAASCSIIASAAVHSEVATGSYWDDALPPGSALPQMCLDIACVDANL